MFLAEFVTYRLARVVYWLNLSLLGVTLISAGCVQQGTGLAKVDMSPYVATAIKHSIVISQCLYAFGGLLCVFSTYRSIAFIVLVQLNYAIAPGWRRYPRDERVASQAVPAALA